MLPLCSLLTPHTSLLTPQSSVPGDFAGYVRGKELHQFLEILLHALFPGAGRDSGKRAAKNDLNPACL
jgi:hypothetical protein